jgi:hypothetical protein
MTADLLMVEHAVVSFFNTHHQNSVLMSELTTALSQTLSSHGKSEQAIEQTLQILPFVLIKTSDAGKTVSLVQRKMQQGAGGEGASCVLEFTCPNVPVVDETTY